MVPKLIAQFSLLPLTAALLTVTGCGDKDSQSSSSSPQASSISSVAESSASTPVSEPPASSSSSVTRPSGPPVATAGPNASGQTPAFPEQTRAPEVITDINLDVEVLATNLGVTWALDFLPDGRMLVNSKGGDMYIVTPSGDISAPLNGVPAVYGASQGGLLDVSVAPDFDSSRYIYFSYSENRGNGENGTTVARGKLSADETTLENVETIFQQTPAWASNLHFGSRLIWDNSGYLYVTLGERSLPSSRVYAQDINTTLGKVVRITADGAAAPGNPFIGGDGMDEVWSYGHRNVQGADLHPVTGKLWTIEHGPRGGDEINVPQAGLNYGWPIITYGEDYSGAPIGEGITSAEGMEQPVYYWDPVIAPSDMTFYTGDEFPEWKGNLFIASLNPGGIVRILLDDETVIGEERLLGQLGRVRDVAQGPDGALYATTDNGSYSVVRITANR